MARRLPASVALAAALALAPASARGQEAPPGAAAPEQPEGAAAGEGPAPAPAGPREPAPVGPREPAPVEPAVPAEAAARPAEPGLLDTSHAAVEERLADLVDWLDRFFGDRRYLEFGPQRSTVRWRSEVRLTDEPRAYPHTTALVDLRLPAATAWLSRAHLVVSGDREAEGAPGDEGPVTELAAGQGRLELRYDLVRRPRTLLYLGGGIRFAWPPDPFTRLRLRQDFHLTTTLLARLTPTAFWELSHGFGATAQLDLDQSIARRALLRASGGVLLSEKSRGLEWGTSLELRAPLASWLVGALGGSMRGVERSPVTVEQYRAFARLRGGILRNWLFAEVEPEMVWPADPAGGYRRVLGVILRLEVLFASEVRPEAAAQAGAPSAPAAGPAAPPGPEAATPPEPGAPPATPAGAAPPAAPAPRPSDLP